MKELIEAGFDLQLLLFSGYVALTISDIGTGKTRSAAVMAFRVFGFGVFVSLIWTTTKSLILFFYPQSENWITAGFHDPIKALAFTALAVFSGAIWRRYGRFCFYVLLRKLRIIRDDGSPSAIHTLMNQNVPWHFIRLHMKDGAKFTCNLIKLPDTSELVIEPVTFNTDGVLMHVTHAKKAGEDNETDRDVKYGNGRTIVRYFPMASIDWIEVGWRKSLPKLSKKQNPAVQSLEAGTSPSSEGA